MDAMSVVRHRLELDAMNLLTAAIDVTIRRGGRFDEALERISDSIHDQQRLEDTLHALTASGRSAMVVLGIFPFAFAAFF
jgi:tight adherence protein B